MWWLKNILVAHILQFNTHIYTAYTIYVYVILYRYIVLAMYNVCVYKLGVCIECMPHFQCPEYTPPPPPTSSSPSVKHISPTNKFTCIEYKSTVWNIMYISRLDK